MQSFFMSSDQLAEFPSQFVVGMADFAVSHDPALILVSNPLGACLGIAIYDPAIKVGGLLHSLLPASSIDPQRAALRPGMFLDSGLAAMLARAEQMGAKKENLLVYIAGGAQIMDESTFFNIGQRNYQILGRLLMEMKLSIEAQQIGGRSNQIMQLHLDTGEVRLKATGQAKATLLCKP
jgi:chemotaxis protein CheD